MYTRDWMSVGVGLLALQAASAHAAPTRSSVRVGDTSYTAYVDHAAARVVEDPAPASLARDATRRGPGCDEVEANLAPLADYIDACRQASAENSPDACETVRGLIDLVRFDAGTAGVSELEQHWRTTPERSEPEDEAAVVDAVHDATGLAAGAIELIDLPQPIAEPRRGRVYVRPDGSSWASKLQGFVDLGSSLSRASDHWQTRDHVLACGLQAGDVSLQWEQTSALSSEAPALNGDELWALYAVLRAIDLDALEQPPVGRRVAVGAAIGSALAALPIASDDPRFGAALGIVLDAFFEGDTLDFVTGLSEADVRSLLASAVPQANLPWSANTH